MIQLVIEEATYDACLYEGPEFITELEFYLNNDIEIPNLIQEVISGYTQKNLVIFEGLASSNPRRNQTTAQQPGKLKKAWTFVKGAIQRGYNKFKNSNPVLRTRAGVHSGIVGKYYNFRKQKLNNAAPGSPDNYKRKYFKQKRDEHRLKSKQLIKQAWAP